MDSENDKKTHQDNIKIFVTPVFFFKRTQEVAVHNRNILDSFNGNLGKALETQQGSPLDYGSEFRYPTCIANLLHHHEDKDKIMEIIQRGSQ